MNFLCKTFTLYLKHKNPAYSHFPTSHSQPLSRGCLLLNMWHKFSSHFFCTYVPLHMYLHIFLIFLTQIRSYNMQFSATKIFLLNMSWRPFHFSIYWSVSLFFTATYLSHCFLQLRTVLFGEYTIIYIIIFLLTILSFFSVSGCF